MTLKTAKLACIMLLLLTSTAASAQFNTIRKKEFTGYEYVSKKGADSLSTTNQPIDSIAPELAVNDTIIIKKKSKREDFRKKREVRKKHLENIAYDVNIIADTLPLTIPNLLNEIRNNGIQHEKVVLAQAILETGWFTSSVCRNKNNLFGLTNPRTGQYYEFNHWSESVKAYYTKVQYRYKEGNYLLWLKKIGYAEDPRYVSSLIRILRQYML